MFDETIQTMEDCELSTKRRLKEMEEKRKDIDFYTELTIKDYFNHVKNIWSPYFPYTESFYHQVQNEKDPKHKDSLKEFKNMLKHVTTDKIKIKEFIWVGLESYAFKCDFTYNNTVYSFEIPLRKNLTYNTITNYQGTDINPYAGKFILYLKKGCCYTMIWNGWECNDELKEIFKENENGDKADNKKS